uniref:Reverse transcriptase zinc-binding domain-containing protein n=1 Tax=Fagus sylvatica TaxID=28930 RepID=A0A2N9HS76_FAGSY
MAMKNCQIRGSCFCSKNAIETRNQIFFDCSFSKRLWRNVMALCLISDPQFCWEYLVEWGFMHLNGKGLRANLCKLTSWATVYYLWFQRNALLHAGQVVAVAFEIQLCFLSFSSVVGNMAKPGAAVPVRKYKKGGSGELTEYKCSVCHYAATEAAATEAAATEAAAAVAADVATSRSRKADF